MLVFFSEEHVFACSSEIYTRPKARAIDAVVNVTKNAIPRVITTLKVAHLLLLVSL